MQKKTAKYQLITPGTNRSLLPSPRIEGAKHIRASGMLGMLVILLLSTTVVVYGQTTPPSAEKVLEEARAVATKENKNVFIIFHASWCGWCHKMDTAMNDPTVKKYFDDNYVIRHLVVLESKNKKSLENPGALELMKQSSAETSGIPFWLIYNKNGEKIFDSRARTADGTAGDNVGCPASEKEVEHFIKVLKASSSIDEKGLEDIRKRFRKIETGM